MVNPWMKKNPFMSMWLSGANAMTGKARSAGMAELGRQQAEFTKQVIRFWSGAWLLTPKSKTRP